MRSSILAIMALCLVASLSQQHYDYTYLSLYNNNSGLHSFVRSLTSAYPTVSEIRKCKEDESLMYLHIGQDRPAKAVIVCNIHAREFITAEVCIHWAKQYLEKSKGNSTFSDFALDLFYLPNPNRDSSIVYHKCVRKSVSGKDLNRNFPTEFRFYPTTPSSQIYPGESPIDDPFTKCLSAILEQQKPVLFLDLHSGQNGGMFYQQGFNSRQDRQILERVNQKVCANNCRITTLARDGEAINGHIFADVKVRLHTKYSLLLEIYGSESKECLAQFNPTTGQEKDKTIQQWSDAMNLIVQEVRARQNL